MPARHAEHLATRFGCGTVTDLSGPVARGAQGEVWRLTTASGSLALKVLYEAPSESEAQADAAYQDAVRSTGVPMPRVVRSVDGRVLVHVDGHCVRAYEWIEMCDLDARLEPAVVGELVASIHRVRSVCERRPVDPWYFEAIGAERWDELFSALELRGAPDGMSLGAMRDELVALERLLAPARDLQVCHRDLWAENVRRTPAGGMCVIDWENGGLADPSQELGAVLFEYGLDDPSRVRCLYDAYVESGGPGRIQEPGDFSMLIAQLGHIFEWACTRWVGAGSEADRARAADSLREFADRPVTRDVVDQLLHTVAG